MCPETVHSRPFRGDCHNPFIKSLLALFLIFSTGLFAEPSPTYPGKDTWQLTFEEDFSGNAVDEKKWTFRDRDQYVYHDRNYVSVSDGNLHLKIDKDPRAPGVVSGRIDTHIFDEKASPSKWSQQYGFFECRAKVPPTHETYFAFWFMSPGVEYIDGTGHDGCEIDVTETAFHGDYTMSTLHWDGYGASHRKASSGKKAAPHLHDGYHLYGLEWEPDCLKFYFDGQLTWQYSGIAVPQVKEYLILSGGSGDGWVEGHIKDAQLPCYAHVDYVRAWTKVNGVQNGDFESGQVSPWTVQGAAGITNSQTFTQKGYSGYVNQGGALEQTLHGLKPDTTYVCSAYVRLQHLHDSAFFGVRDGEGEENFRQIRTHTYGLQQVSFTTGPASTSAILYFTKPAWTAEGTAWIDEVTVVPQTALALNGDFETGDLPPWSPYKMAGVGMSFPHAGSYAGYVTADSSLEQVVTGLIPSTTYRYTAMAKVEKDGEKATLGVTDFCGRHVGAKEVVTEVRDVTYRPYGVTFSTGASANSAKIYLSKATSHGNGHAYLDQVRVKAAPAYVLNGDFENGHADPWTLFHQGGVTTQPVGAGHYAGYVMPDSSLEQVITGLSPHTTYTLTALARLETPGDTAYLGVKDFGGKETSVPVTTMAYQAHRVTFRTGALAKTAKIYLTKPAAHGQGKAFLDQVMLQPSTH